MLITSKSKLGKFIRKHNVALLFLTCTSFFYGIYNNDYYGVFVWFFFVFGFLFLISNFGKNAKTLKIGAIIICTLYFILYPLTDFLMKSSLQ